MPSVCVCSAVRSKLLLLSLLLLQRDRFDQIMMLSSAMAC